MTIDPRSAALYAVVAICLVLVGAILTPGTLSIEQRGPVLAAIVSVLLFIGWRMKIRKDGDE